MAAREAQDCIRCGREIRTDESAVAMFLYCQTVGIKRRQKSKAAKLYLCSPCATVTAMGPAPPKGQPLNIAAYSMIRVLVGADPAVVEKAWEELNQITAPAPALPPGEVIPPERRPLRLASSF